MVLLSDAGDASPPSVPARLRAAARPILGRAAVSDPRAYLWTTAGLELFAAGLGLSPRSTVIDAGCGWGALGAALALQIPGLRVVAVDLEPDLLALGQQVVAAAGLERQVRWLEEDLEQLEPGRQRGVAAVACQAVLAHVPRAGAWVAELSARCPPGVVLGFVERDAVEAARTVTDSVTDDDEGYAETREQVARAVVRGARRTLGVERRTGALLGDWLVQAGLADVVVVPLPADVWLRPPYGPGCARAGWFRERLGRRLGAADPVEQGLAAAGGLGEGAWRSWCAQRDQADRRRLAALDAGRWRREEPGGWTMAWGRVPAMR